MLLPPIPAEKVSKPETAPPSVNVPVPVVELVSLTLSLSINAIFNSYYDVKLIIAFAGVLGSGNTIVKSPLVAVFVPPKSKITHNLSDLSSL